VPGSLSVATWNINSVRLRLPTVIDFLHAHSPDLLCLQEIKCQNHQFPADALAKAGFEVFTHISKNTGHGIAPDGLGTALQFIKMKLDT